MNILFVDLDKTIRRPKKGEFIYPPEEQEIIPEALNALRQYMDWTIIGITNQYGVKKQYKTLEEAIREQRFTMQLIADQGNGLFLLQEVLFCPDGGDTCCRVTAESLDVNIQKITEEQTYLYNRNQGYAKFRKPDIGMLQVAMHQLSSAKIEKSLLVGDDPTDKECANNANIPFLWAHEWQTFQQNWRRGYEL